MIPKAVSEEHVLAALAAIGHHGVPATRASRGFDLVHAGRRYPPKFVVSLACREATGRALPSDAFSGGAETNRFLAALGFEVVGKAGRRVGAGGRPAIRNAASGYDPSVPDIVRRLTLDAPLYRGRQLQAERAAPPSRAGIYAWFFEEIPPGVPVDGCVRHDGRTLLYVGISPTSASSGGTLRSRIRFHYQQNAEGSTLRLTLGCLLKGELGTVLRRVGSGKRLTFGPREAALSRWMADNASVAWVEFDRPWAVERTVFERLSLPLNIEGNGHHPFCPTLRELRRRARAHARVLGVRADW